LRITIFFPNAEEFKEEERRGNLAATLLLLVLLLLPRRVVVVKVSLVCVVLAKRLLLTEKTTVRFCAEFVGVIRNGSIFVEGKQQKVKKFVTTFAFAMGDFVY
tara:strand:+ start:178 stop:486 length:309 start_codon:yes stop_codon:yes gene_type:complete